MPTGYAAIMGSKRDLSVQIYTKIPNYKPVGIKNQCHFPELCHFEM